MRATAETSPLGIHPPMVAFRNTDTSGRTTGLLLRCVLYSLLALGLIIVDKRYDHLGRIRRLPLRRRLSGASGGRQPFEGWNWFRDSVTTRDALRADKAKLEAELRLAQFRLQRYEALEAETQSLRALRDNTAGVTDRFRHRRCHGCGSGCVPRAGAGRQGCGRRRLSWARRCWTRAASSVRWPGSGSSPAKSFSSATLRMPYPVQINRTGLRTIAVGTGDMSRLKLPYLPTSADVVVGDLLVTSGLGGGFPAGYPVGTVAEVKRDPSQSLADVDVKPAAALDRSRELMFVWLKPQAAEVLPQPAAPEPAAPKPAAPKQAATKP